ncbi:DUF2180 family protein [Streptomyces sp. BH097]|uniref:DUF2180 family protein n=1 Tax=unclassified Streptomyces TaxID=2593676 RepID=UPI003BB6B593
MSMNCYDCAAADTSVSAVAVCRRCGAGICVQHAHVGHVSVPRTAGTGLSESHALARHLTCDVCHHAEVAE